MATVRPRMRPRLLLIVPAALCLVLGVLAGLSLLGVPVPVVVDRWAEHHAALLVFGFAGSLISLERAVALRRGWPYVAPVLLSAGVIVVVSPAPSPAGEVVVTAGLVVHLAQYVAISRRQPATATDIQLLGAAAAIVASLAWTGGVAPSHLVPLLAAFLVLTIVGERLELARLSAPGARAETLLFTASAGFATAATVALVAPTVAVPLAGAALVAIVAWLVRWDVARRFVGRPGLPGYVAVCLLLGYGWLIVAGIGWILGGARTEGPLYDATTHAVFLGFVITMIMAHAPIILPAVLGVGIPYHPALSAPVALLQLALVVRVVGGDAWGSIAALRTGGVGAALAVVAFAVTVVAVGVGRRATERRSQDVAT